MADRAVIDVVGVRVKVRAPDLAAGSLRDRLGAPIVDEPPDCAVSVDGSSLEAVLAAATMAAIERAPGLLLHAGAVARGCQAVLFSGASGAGKSTLTAACVRRGLDYVTDEVVAINLESSTMTGFARPIMLTAWAAGVMRVDVPPETFKLPVTAEALGGVTNHMPLCPAHVVEVRHGAPATALAPMTAGATLTALLHASFNHYRHGERAWRAAADIAGRAQGWQLDVADLDSAVDVIDGLLDGEAA